MLITGKECAVAMVRRSRTEQQAARQRARRDRDREDKIRQATTRDPKP